MTLIRKLICWVRGCRPLTRYVVTPPYMHDYEPISYHIDGYPDWGWVSRMQATESRPQFELIETSCSRCNKPQPEPEDPTQ